jgi:hypothetical protein
MRGTWTKHVGHLRLCRGFHEGLSEVFSPFNGHRLIQRRVDLWCELALSQLQLLLLCKSIDLFVIKVFEVLLGHFPQLLIAFQEQVVRRRHVVMLVGIDALYGVVLLKVVLDEELEDLHVDRDLRQADEDATGDLLDGDLVEPGVLPDVRDLESLLWVRVEDVRDEVPRIC